MKLIARIRQEFDLSDMKGDPFEDLGKFFILLFIIFGLGIIALVIKGIIYLIHNI